MNADVILVITKKNPMVTHEALVPELSVSATTSRKPVFTSAELNTNISPTVRTAWLLNPEMASSIERRSVARSTVNKANAVTSKGKISLTKRIRATEMMKKKRRDSPGMFMAPHIIVLSLRKRVLVRSLAFWRLFDDTRVGSDWRISRERESLPYCRQAVLLWGRMCVCL